MTKNTQRSSWKRSTRLTHAKQIPLPEKNESIVSPIYQTAKFALAPDLAIPDQFIYTRISNPTLRELEDCLSETMNKEDTIVFASGIAAITSTLLSLLSQDDHILIFREVYKPTRIFVRDILPRFGVKHTILPLSELPRLEEHIQTGKTRLVYFESPTNPNLQIADIKTLTETAKKNNLLTIMDSTFAGIHQHVHYSLDLVIHSLTKFANGHGDVTAGSVSGSKTLIAKIRHLSIFLGATLDPHAAFLILRGLKTYDLRVERQAKSALEIARYLKKHPKIKKVYYPGLEDHPGYEIAKNQMEDFGGIVAFEVDPSLGRAVDICKRGQLLKFTASVGSTESLICPSLQFFGDDLPEADRLEMGLHDYSLRLSVGLEDPEDLIGDLEQMLRT